LSISNATRHRSESRTLPILGASSGGGRRKELPLAQGMLFPASNVAKKRPG
jgi:hypothetical protein